MTDTNKVMCIVMAMYQYNCRNERLMWQWLLEWASWGEDMGCHIDSNKVTPKPKKKWRGITERDKRIGNTDYPTYPMANVWEEGAEWAADVLKRKNT